MSFCQTLWCLKFLGHLPYLSYLELCYESKKKKKKKKKHFSIYLKNALFISMAPWFMGPGLTVLLPVAGLECWYFCLLWEDLSIWMTFFFFFFFFLQLSSFQKAIRLLQIIHKYLRGIDILGRLSTILYKGDNFYDFLFACFWKRVLNL